MLNEKKITIKICMGSSCFARGNSENLLLIEKFIEKHNLDADIELIGNRCKNECLNGPYISINGLHYKKIKQEQLITILEETILKGSINE